MAKIEFGDSGRQTFMTNQRKITANQINARASTGPKSELGKSRATRNARRHGLSISIFSDPNRSAEIDNLALKIAGQVAEPDVIELARDIARAQIDLARIRQARHDLLSRELDDPEFRPKEFFKNADVVIKGISGLLPAYGPNDRVLHWKKPQGAHKFAYILSDLSHQLLAIDRYEQRVLSRRKSAIRAFECAKWDTMNSTLIRS
jgi:hypothetical protein